MWPAGLHAAEAAHLRAVLLRTDNFLAGPQAAPHFAVDAAGVIRRDGEIVLATADLKEILQCDLKREMAAHPLYDSAIEHCESVRDYVTRELLVQTQKSEEEHIDFIEEQLGLIDKMGLQNYIQSATGELNESA